MRDFKNYLKEFVIKNTPRENSNNDDYYTQVMDFMKTVPFRFNTRQGDLIHFDSAYDAARSLFKHLEQHESGHNHAVQQEAPHMIRYFQNSTKTHEKALDLLGDYITHHQKLPEHLRAKVEPTMGMIQSDILDEHETERDKLRGQKDVFGRPADDIGRRVFHMYGGSPIEIAGEEYHPQQEDQMHHLEGVASDLADASGMGGMSGYIRRREENS